MTRLVVVAVVGLAGVGAWFVRGVIRDLDASLAADHEGERAR